MSQRGCWWRVDQPLQTLPAQWPSNWVNAQRLGGHGFDPQPGRTKDCPIASLLGSVSGCSWGFGGRLPNDSRVRPCYCSLLPQGRGQLTRTNFAFFGMWRSVWLLMIICSLVWLYPSQTVQIWAVYKKPDCSNHLKWRIQSKDGTCPVPIYQQPMTCVVAATVAFCNR